MGARPIIKTAHGHELGEVVSALQKQIRRGNVDDALYWAVELDLAGYGQWLWNRLLVIASEDVGIINWSLVPLVRALYDNWREMRNKNEHAPERLFIVHAVTAITISNKNRYVDHATITHYADHDNLRREVPDFALDKHTRRGKIKRRGVDHFYEEGAKVFPQGWDSHHPMMNPDAEDVLDPYGERARELQANGAEMPPVQKGPRRKEDPVQGTIT